MNLFRLLRHICHHPINRNRRAGAVWDFVCWQIVSRLKKNPVRYQWINGTTMLVSRGDNGFTMNIYCGLQDEADMGYLLHVLSPDDLFVDVGANVGAYTALAAGALRSRVICFEPVPETFSRLSANLAANSFGSRATAQNVGVGDKAGKLRFSVGQNCQNHVLPDGDDSPAVEVEVVTLDEALAGQSPSLLKIDVEGFELAVLARCGPAFGQTIASFNSHRGQRRDRHLWAQQVCGAAVAGGERVCALFV